MVSVKVEVEREVDVNAILHAASVNMLTRAMLAVHKAAAQPGVVPIDTGMLRGSLAPGAGTTAVDEGALTATIGTNLIYGGVLDAADNRHYRGGPSAGQVTQGWLTTNALGAAMPDIDAAIATMASEIEAGWGGKAA